MKALGIDVGGSGIKGAIVDTATGAFLSDRVRIPTPRGMPPEAMLGTLLDFRKRLSWEAGPIGIGFPGVIRGQTIRTSANLDDRLVGVALAKDLENACGDPVCLFNDADAAGFAEIRLGAGTPYAERGTVLLLTIGTGIGTVLFRNGHLLPNLELGHVEFKGGDAEEYVSEHARKKTEMSWKRWGKRFDLFLAYLDRLLSPDLIILGGGGVKKPEKFEAYLRKELPLVFARFGNRAGIIGAAIAASDLAAGTAELP
ncbi:MAG: ROK family protein [Verrucomicrobia bacterium]|jgi:polyphosphate glucokinase|nr:ROK family protein [Verrucomicrobiota bacterium]